MPQEIAAAWDRKTVSSIRNAWFASKEKVLRQWIRSSLEFSASACEARQPI
jgi:hypothetical protein